VGLLAKGEILCSDNEVMDRLFLILHGKVVVNKNGKHIAELTRGSFVAEMGFLTESAASADVLAAEEVKYIAWTRKRLTAIDSLHYGFSGKLKITLSRDLTHKLKKYL